MKETYKNMKLFYDQGNSLKLLYDWTRQTYGFSNAGAIMSGFMNHYKNIDKKMFEEFKKTAFI